MKKKLTLSDVNKKHLKIISLLLGSWVISLGIVYITGNEKLVGLAPVLNYIYFTVEKELKGEGYQKVLKK